MILNYNFKSDEKNKELLPMNSMEFPYVCNFTNMDSLINNCIPWHWHPLIEIDYVFEGAVELKTPDHIEYVQQGEIFFVNSGVIHTITAKDKTIVTKTYAHLFDMHFLSGIHNSLFEQKYLVPIVKSKTLDIFVIRPNNYKNIKMIEKVLEIIELNKSEDFGYEFEIRSKLCKFWCMLLTETENLRSDNTPKNDIDIDRMKAMLQYIHEHYMEKITLDAIASSASISNRECSRCFQRCIETSPINYLTEHRVRMATQMLLQTQDDIVTISENCGFSSSSYFGKVFHELMGCTPKHYRK